MKRGAFVRELAAGLAHAQRAEVLRGFGHNVVEELELDADPEQPEAGPRVSSGS